MEALPEVESTATILDFVPTEQDDKLDILADLELVFDLPGGIRTAAPVSTGERAAGAPPSSRTSSPRCASASPTFPSR